MNARFEYLYRDASNFKKWGSVVFGGALSDDLRARIRRALHDEEWFIADQVGVPELLFDDYPLNQDDHCWHEFSVLVDTDEVPNDTRHRSIEDFVREVEQARADGWREFDPIRRAAGER